MASRVPWSALIAGLLGCFVGFGGALPVVLAAAAAMKATPVETASWVCGLCLAIAISTAILSWRTRMPVVTAWSTPGAAVIAAAGGSIDMPLAVGAFIAVAVMILLTATFKPLAELINRLPMPIASAMLAGVLFRFVADMVQAVAGDPTLVLTMIAVFLAVRHVHPMAAALAALAAGIAMSAVLGNIDWTHVTLQPAGYVLIAPRFEVAAVAGLALPLYLVTMASQNLPGLAVLRANGYAPALQPILAVTGLLSLLTAPLGAHTSNLAAISAAIAAGPDCHPDPRRRWVAGLTYSAGYALLAVLGASVVAVFAALPKALITTIAGLALTGAFAASMAGALVEERARFAAAVAFVATASGIAVMGIGAPFWGLVSGLAVLAIDNLRHKNT